MSASYMWRRSAEGERLHPTLAEVIYRYNSCSLDDYVNPSEVSGVLRQLAEDEALMRRGLELAEYLQQAFRAASGSRLVSVERLAYYADLWAARAREYVRCGAWTVWRAQRVAHQAELAAAAAAKKAKEAAAARARADRLLEVRAAVEHALALREEERRAEEERAEAARSEEARVEAERSRARRLSEVRAAVERALEKRAEDQRAAKQELAACMDFAAAHTTAEDAVVVALPSMQGDTACGAGYRAAHAGIEQPGQLPRKEHGDRHATTSGPGPPHRDGPSEEPVRVG